MSRPLTAPPSGAAQARSPARIALAVGLLVLGIGALAVITFVLVPLQAAEGSYRPHAVASYRGAAAAMALARSAQRRLTSMKTRPSLASLVVSTTSTESAPTALSTT